MASGFDPYYKWLGIPPEDEPPNHYRLLGLRQFESDPEVIEAASDQRMAHLRTYPTGPMLGLVAETAERGRGSKILSAFARKTRVDTTKRCDLL